MTFDEEVKKVKEAAERAKQHRHKKHIVRNEHETYFEDCHGDDCPHCEKEKEEHNDQYNHNGSD